MKKFGWAFVLICASFNAIHDGLSWWNGEDARTFVWGAAILFSMRVASDAIDGLFP
jgi:hypothetical protein